MNSKGEKIALIIIDPQNDFCSPKGALYVPGAEKDNERLAAWILNNKSKVDQVVVTVDSHHTLDISHPKFWTNKNGENPAPFTIIKAQDLIDDVWYPAYQLFNKGIVLTYLEMLEKQGEFPHCIWPEHCILHTYGCAIDTMINGALREWILSGSDARFVNYITKGTYPMTEHFGAFKAQLSIPNVKETSINFELIESLNRYDVVYLSGQAKSHCVANSLKQIMEINPLIAKKFVILEDTMSNVPGFETLADPIYNKAKEFGIRFTTTAEEVL